MFSTDCRTPVPNALIEVWPANQTGVYDTGTPGNFTERHAFPVRGMRLTDRQGRYEFATAMPGRYPVPPGLPGLEKYAGLTRPAQIHFRVSEALHVPLATQLYFRGDPFASRKPSLTVALADSYRPPRLVRHRFRPRSGGGAGLPPPAVRPDPAPNATSWARRRAQRRG